MILYHTSDREIVHPDIHYGRKNADFGWGFYLTPDREFTYRWARDNAVVNYYRCWLHSQCFVLVDCIKAASLGNSLCYVDRYGNCGNYAAWDFSFS